ncbi:MAG: NAD(P)/FAD-dependent oxidoreductase, partial [Chloroflexi bacterium]|nr:NAD(P)/FAD-dependent oxidoreductase [Chloroflexota bacterium]
WGVGGLCAGALLAHRGFRVLAVESERRIGGRCSTEGIEGYKLSTGAVALHRGGALDDIFREVGATLELVNMPHQFYRIGAVAGNSYTMPVKGAVAALLEIGNNVETERAKLLGHMAKEVAVAKVMSFFGRGVRGQEKTGDITFREWLSKYTENELAQKTFDAIACNVTSYHTYEITAPEMFALFATMGTYPALGAAPNGNEANMKSLARVIEAHGGDVWIECPAKRIIVRDGSAEGIAVEKKGKLTEIGCRAVISNIGPRRTVKLAGEEHFDQSYLKFVESLVPVGMILVHVASDSPLCLENGELGGALLVGLRRLTSAFPLTNFSPTLAPAGKHLLYCVGSPPSYLEAIDFDEELQQTTLDLKDQFPEFSKSGRIVKFEVVSQELPRPGRMRVPRDTSVKNLYNVGDGVQTFGSGGTSAAAESAREVAGWVKKRIKPGEK